MSCAARACPASARRANRAGGTCAVNAQNHALAALRERRRDEATLHDELTAHRSSNATIARLAILILMRTFCLAAKSSAMQPMI
jgi:hypothetical protein